MFKVGRGQVGLKRALILEEEDSDDEEGSVMRRQQHNAIRMSASGLVGGTGSGATPSKFPNVASQNEPVNDIYRQRQQMKSVSSFSG